MCECFFLFYCVGNCLDCTFIGLPVVYFFVLSSCALYLYCIGGQAYVRKKLPGLLSLIRKRLEFVFVGYYFYSLDVGKCKKKKKKKPRR